jgi:hypothetical protein
MEDFEEKHIGPCTKGRVCVDQYARCGTCGALGREPTWMTSDEYAVFRKRKDIVMASRPSISENNIEVPVADTYSIKRDRLEKVLRYDPDIRNTQLRDRGFDEEMIRIVREDLGIPNPESKPWYCMTPAERKRLVEIVDKFDGISKRDRFTRSGWIYR